jgi:hypothetical protein
VTTPPRVFLGGVVLLLTLATIRGVDIANA